MNVPYLLKILNTESLPELVANIDLPALDMNLAIWESIDRGEIEVDEPNGTVKLLLAEVEPSSDPDLKNKVLRVIQHYARENTNVTRGRLNSYVKDPVSGQGHPWHEYVMAVQHLIDGDLVEQEVIEVPEGKKTFVKKNGKKKEKVIRPAHKFAFLGLTSNHELNHDWNQKTVDKWIADIDQQMLK
jgi:hypothetical protein